MIWINFNNKPAKKFDTIIKVYIFDPMTQERRQSVMNIQRLLNEAKYKTETLMIELEAQGDESTFDSELDLVLVVCEIESIIECLKKLNI